MTRAFCVSAESDSKWLATDDVAVNQQFAWLVRLEDITLVKLGDFVNIAAHKKHRVEWTTPDEPTIWLAEFYNN